MDDIQYLEKPEWISWDAVLECIKKSHKVNTAKGFHMINQDLCGADMEKKLRDGHCFIALVNNKIVGTGSVRFVKSKRWWAYKKKIAINCLDAILPEYQGTDVYLGIREIRQKCINDCGIGMIQLNTAIQNKVVQRIAIKRGAKYVMFTASGKGADYYSVIMVKWLHGCPYPDWFVKFMFNLSKVVVKTIWKPGYKFRFGLNSRK